MSYAKNSSGFQFIGRKERKIVDPLCVGKATVFQKVQSAIVKSEFRHDVNVKVVKGYTNLYIFKPQKLDKVLKLVMSVVK